MILTNNLFFKPTPIYKEYMILDLIEKDAHVTQRRLSDAIGSSVSMVNYYLDQYEEQGLIKRKKHSTKNVEYFVSKKGMDRRKLLNIWYLKSSHDIYLSAKDNIITFLNQIIDRGFKSILLYGAGEVASIILQVMHDDQNFPLQVLAVIDDDQHKQNQKINNIEIIDKDQINDYDHEGILIASYTHHASIHEKLKAINYNINKIISFFDN